MTPSPAPGLPTTQLLLNALRPDETSTHWEAERVRLNAGWDDLAVRAIVFGLAPQFYDRLNRWGLAPTPRAATKLSLTYQASGQRNREIFAQLGEVLAALNQGGIRAICLKGIHLAALVYPDPALRPMNDIDLLFEPDQLPRAEKILEELGYSGRHKPADRGPGVTKHTSTYLRRTALETATQPPVKDSTPNPYLSPAAERMIEPHISLEESWFGLKVNISAGVWDRALKVEIGGQPCGILAAEDLILHLCVHFCFHLIMGAPSMVQFADLLTVSQAVSRADVWPALVRRAASVHAAPYALAALRLAGSLLAAPVPLEVLDQLAGATPAPLRRRIQTLGLGDMIRRTQQKPLVTLRQRLARGLADRAETAAWAPDWQGRWQVWRTALNIFATDTGMMILGRSPKSPMPRSSS